MLVENKFFHDILTEELEKIFGYPTDYTRLTLNDIQKLAENIQDFEAVAEKMKSNEISRTQRIKRIGQGFSIQAFVPLLKPLTHIFKNHH